MEPYEILYSALASAAQLVKDWEKIGWAREAKQPIIIRGNPISAEEYAPPVCHETPVAAIVEVLLDPSRFRVVVPEESWEECAVYAHHYHTTGQLEFSVGLLEQPIELVVAVTIEEVFHLLDPFDREVPTEGPRWRKEEKLYEQAQRRELRAKLFVREVMLWWRVFGPTNIASVIDRYEQDILTWRLEHEETLPL